MTLRFNIFGFEVAKVELDLGDDDETTPVKAVERLAERGVKAMSKAWVKRMVAG